MCIRLVFGFKYVLESKISVSIIGSCSGFSIIFREFCDINVGVVENRFYLFIYGGIGNWIVWFYKVNKKLIVLFFEFFCYMEIMCYVGNYI